MGTLKLLCVTVLMHQICLITGIVIDLPDGKVEGTTSTSRAGTTFSSFLAMRYAEPPIEELRFELARPVKQWNGVYDATAEKHTCYQVNQDSEKENEDCLFINVFTPKDLQANVEADIPVLVFIHGGGFISGAGYIIEGGVGPNFFMDSNVILVAFNYRLGPFGFLSSGDEVIPGNLGLKDQVLALKWVQSNIGYFGGDKDKVTIFGQSAGSAAVSYHLLSPQSQGLFRGAILESGTALDPWAYQRDQVDLSFLTAARIDLQFETNRNSTDLLAFMKNVSATDIDQASYVLSQILETSANVQISKGFFYAPVIEIEHPDAFLSGRMYELFESGNFNKVPVIIGINSDESLGLLENGDRLYEIFQDYDDLPRILTPHDLHLDYATENTVGHLIKDFYAGNDTFKDNLALGIHFHSAHDFDKASIKQAELQSQYVPVYFYEFTYSGPMGNNNDKLAGTGNVTHAEELNYMFSKWYSTEIPDNTDLTYFPQEDRNVHYYFMTLWSNFVKYLNPTPGNDEVLQNVKWAAVDPTQFKFLNIGKDLVMTSGYPKSDSYVFWQNIFDQYAVKPLDTFSIEQSSPEMALLRRIYVCLLFCSCFYFWHADGIIIELPNGKVEGITKVTRAGTTFHEFLALRYAQPPVGPLRFKPPLPLEPWTDVYNATEERNICYQVQFNKPTENEDCLFLNVFTPKDIASSNEPDLPVMIYIHGGGFVIGSGLIDDGGTGPDFFMNYDVILVSINYRLGPFGFLSTGDLVIPGNLGLKDQVMALKWVQENIAYFGGDPDKVTIFGQSAGAASVSYQLLSPTSAGLYRAAILDSGSALCPWAYQRSQVEISYETAALIDPRFETNRNSSDLLTFLKDVDASKIDEASAALSITLGNSGNVEISKGFFYAPVVEADHEGAFLTELMYESFENGRFNRVPILMGLVAEESLMNIGNEYLSDLFRDYDQHPTYLVPFDMHISNQDDLRAVGYELINFYGGDVGFENDTLRGIQFHSGNDFDKAIVKQAELQSTYTPTYFYEFAYVGIMGNNPSQTLPGSANVTHSEELYYLFSRYYNENITDNTNLTYFPVDDQNVQRRMITLWTNFGKYLNPTPEKDEVLQNVTWPTVQPDSFQYLYIGKDLEVKSDAPKNYEITFWQYLYDSYAIRPYDTY
ncbi:uncharacterized protein LOC132705150 [Cylas formicarius]|uniref:uncharacterized protein LOC132705150 n=1 Tax=Cylas formicarius TaxID=197179 RepID=UPI002958BB1D|nr:uncharacterized protein LOC132705150 [Cylas formicarius]